VFHELFRWIEEDLGKRASDGLSWSQQLHGSLNLWNLTEGTHVLTIMFFAGTIWIIDLRMMGLAFKNVPFSKLNDRVLPITVIAFAAMIITGVITFFGRTPMAYYHDIWFRTKMIFLIVASINIFYFHYRIQKDQETWDAMEKPPTKVRLSGAISMASWLIVIIMGRFIAYDWFHCEKIEKGSLVYALQECDSQLSYLNNVAGEGEAPAEEAAPAETPPAETPPPADGAAPATPAPAQPAPGNGG
jgi:hypothetical protein